MNHLLQLIADHRFESTRSRMARTADQEFITHTLPALHEAFPDDNDLDDILAEISQYLIATELSAYLDGIRDCIELIKFDGPYGDIANNAV